MYRTHTCGELRLSDAGKRAKLCGWVQGIRDKGSILWLILRDRYGITQAILEEGKTSEALLEQVRSLGREFVVQIEGEVIERLSKNPKIPTGEIEISLDKLKIINEATLPPFLIEDDTDGGEELRMKYRYLDLRRGPMQQNIMLRHKLLQQTRQFLDGQQFCEIETPVLIKSTPEGARDFVVPSRMNAGQFYALPQSPQTFKQLLMVSGFDKYYQIVKCFRDEDLRADRQPEFTQIDCEMSFVTQKDVQLMFEGLIRHLFRTVKNITLGEFPTMSYDDAMDTYGSDKPDIRFGMPFVDLTTEVKGKDFNVFDQAEWVGGICVTGGASYSRKVLDKLTDFAKKPQVGAKGLVYIKYNEDGSVKSSVDKFYDQADFEKFAQKANAKQGDLLLLLSGPKRATQTALGILRLEMGDRLELRDPNVFAPLWVTDFPLLEWLEDEQRYQAMHHPFTSPKDWAPGSDKPLHEHYANAYDMAQPCNMKYSKHLVLVMLRPKTNLVS